MIQRTAAPRLILFTLLLPLFWPGVAQAAPNVRNLVRDKYDAVMRGDVTKKKLSLVFTGDRRGESTAPILDTLKDRKIKAALFVTGNFVRNAKLQMLLKRALAEGHYLGPHSDAHPLYCSWDRRERSLVTKTFFKRDLLKNIAELEKLGALRDTLPTLFIPPYEWHNRDQARWSAELDVTLINFTPGSGSNRDYAPEGERNFVPSHKIYDDILAYEQKFPQGLNGFVLLLHLGSGRKDPFHPLLGPLCDEIRHRGYEFSRVDELLGE
jgi:peptidoglycan/xylan/chitin deacetylase (PgdA/CDA1 family)